MSGPAPAVLRGPALENLETVRQFITEAGTRFGLQPLSLVPMAAASQELVHHLTEIGAASLTVNPWRLNGNAAVRIVITVDRQATLHPDVENLIRSAVQEYQCRRDALGTAFELIQGNGQAAPGSSPAQRKGSHAPHRDVLMMALARKRDLEATERAAAAKDRFLAVMSHEIRTPLNAMLGLSSILLHTRLDSRQIEHVETMLRSGRHLLSVLNDVLDMAKASEGPLDLDNGEFSIRATVDEAFEMMANDAAEKQLELIPIVHANVGTRVRGDSGRLRQIFLNLLSNAIKFTPKGSVIMRVMRHGTRVTVRVEDSGPGIAPHDALRLFEPFHQVGSVTQREHGGTGLGLAISQRVVQAMGGEIKYERRAEGGSCFSFDVYLPEVENDEPLPLHDKEIIVVMPHNLHRESIRLGLQSVGAQTRCYASLAEANIEASHGAVVLDEADAERLNNAKEGQVYPIAVLGPSGSTDVGIPLAPPYPLHRLLYIFASTHRASSESQLAKGLRKAVENMTILVVEDNPVNLIVTEALLESVGAKIVSATSGAQALERVRSSDPDIILMDVEMPDMDGLETTRQIRRMQDRHPMVLAVTAHVTGNIRRRCMDSGMNGYLAKPFTPDQLYESIIKLPLVRKVIA